jgi:hypothetical protein
MTRSVNVQKERKEKKKKATGVPLCDSSFFLILFLSVEGGRECEREGNDRPSTEGVRYP